MIKKMEESSTSSSTLSNSFQWIIDVAESAISWSDDDDDECQSVSNSSNTSSSSENNLQELQMANAELVRQITTAIDFCRKSGISQPSIDQLERNLKMQRYFAVTNRLQHYVFCLTSQSRSDELATMSMIIAAWTSLCKFKALQYKRAYKYVYILRDDAQFSIPEGKTYAAISRHDDEIERAIHYQIKLAEQCTACRKKLYLVQQSHRRIVHHHKQ